MSKRKGKGTIINDEELKMLEELKESLKVKLGYMLQNDGLLALKHRQEHEVLTLEQQLQNDDLALKHRQEDLVFKQESNLRRDESDERALAEEEKALTIEKKAVNSEYIRRRGNLLGKHKDEINQIEIYKTLNKKLANEVMDKDKLLQLKKTINELHSDLIWNNVDTFISTGRLGGSTLQKKRILKAPTKGKGVKAKRPVKRTNKATK